MSSSPSSLYIRLPGAENKVQKPDIRPDIWTDGFANFRPLRNACSSIRLYDPINRVYSITLLLNYGLSAYASFDFVYEVFVDFLKLYKYVDM